MIRKKQEVEPFCPKLITFHFLLVTFFPAPPINFFVERRPERNVEFRIQNLELFYAKEYFNFKSK